MDIVVTNNNGPLRLLLNQGNTGNHWLEVRLEGVQCNRMGLGAKVAPDATLIEVLHLGEQICLRLLIGTGAELVVKRPAAAGTRGLTVGSTVAIAWQPSHARALQVK